MSLGAFAAQFLLEVFSPQRRAGRKERRRVRKKHRRGEVLTAEEAAIMEGEKVLVTFPDGRTIERTEPIVKARSSTKMLAVGGSLLATTAAAVIPNWDAINTAMLDACKSEHGPAIGLGMMGLMLVVNFATTRLVKSPVVPGKV